MGAAVNFLADSAFDCLCGHVGNDAAAKLPLALHSAEDRGFVGATSASARSLVTRLPWPDVCFIAFDRASQFRTIRIRSHRKPDAVHKEQSGLIANLTLPLDLKGRNTFLGSSRTPECIAPVAKLNP